MEMNLIRLVEQFGSEEKCRAYLEALRWPDGLACPRCGGMTISRIKKRGQFDCDACRYQFSVTAGTIFHDTKLPLWKWFAAVYLMVEAKKGISANQMKRTLGVSYKTAWYLCHRIRAAMGSTPEEKLRGIIEADETYVGGKRKDGKGVRKGPFEDKLIIAGALERGGHIRLRVINDTRRHTIKKFLAEAADLPGADAFYTDKLASYAGLHGNHGSVNHKNEEWVRGEVHTQGIESAWSLFKRSIVGSYHQLSARHIEAYLDEFEWRFNNRDNDQLFDDTMEALLTAETLTYKELTA